MSAEEIRAERVRQLVQSVKSGDLRLVEVPVPEIGSTEVLVRTEFSMISAGTERTVRNLASASLLSKARARPDLVRKVIQKARTDGLSNAVGAVRSRLSDEMPLGYSGAGTVIAVGDAVPGIRPGMRVATGGVGHGEMQVVPGLLCAPIPDGVSTADASFATIAAIALHGIRRAEVEPGGEIVILGLGLIGQIGLRLAVALGYRVLGLDVSEWAVDRATEGGFDAHVDAGAVSTEAILRWSRVGGADAVVVMASTPSSEPVRRSVDLLRDRGTIVVVGDVGLELERTPLYEKELTLRLARSYGPGRYERSYEDWAVDFPPGFVRWTEGRNLGGILDLIASGRLDLAPLVTHEFSFDDVDAAYELVGGRAEPMLGVRLAYGTPRTVAPRAPVAGEQPGSEWIDQRGNGVAFIGAGNFARGVLLPAMKEAGFSDFVGVASATGVSAERLARDGGFRKGALTVDEILADPDVAVVVITTTHEHHAGLAARALRAGCHVFCEKPLALALDELADVRDASEQSGRILFVGFNRRYSPSIAALNNAVGEGPKHITYRVNAGPVMPAHWYADRRHGGRLIGEVSHFVDTCLAITGSLPHQVSALAQNGPEGILAPDFVVQMAFPDGSLATIDYCSEGPSSEGKERIDVVNGGHRISIDDFRTVLDGTRVLSRGSQDKGHVAIQRAFRAQIDGTEPGSAGPFLGSSRTSLLVAESMGFDVLTSSVVVIPPSEG